jgi:hypothetical protein
MARVDDLSRSRVPLDQDPTLICVVELSRSRQAAPLAQGTAMAERRCCGVDPVRRAAQLLKDHNRALAVP